MLAIVDLKEALFCLKLTKLARFVNGYRPTNKAAAKQPNGKGMEVGIADDQAKDFDFEKTEMKYDSTGMFHWTPGG